MDWYTQLPPQQQAALQGLVVMVLFAAIKAVAYWAGKPLSNTAVAKVGKLLAVAVATAATTLVTVGGTPQFWMAWGLALVTAIGSWEIISKAYSVPVAAQLADQ